MHAGYHTLTGAAADIPINEPKPVVSFSPVVLPDSGRVVDLQLRVTAPSTGDALPIILLSHGHGRSNSLSSLEGYAPLAEFWAAHGFAVLQPTHLSSAFLGLKGPEGQEMFWQDRAADMVRILDNLDRVEASTPGLKGARSHRWALAGRVDHRVAPRGQQHRSARRVDLVQARAAHQDRRRPRWHWERRRGSLGYGPDSRASLRSKLQYNGQAHARRVRRRRCQPSSDGPCCRLARRPVHARSEPEGLAYAQGRKTRPGWHQWMGCWRRRMKVQSA
jgi:hypothetical protein